MRPDPNHVCEIIAFPIDPDLLHARKVARILAIRDELGAARFWRQEWRRLEARLIVLRLDKQAIQARLLKFEETVHREMQAAFWAEQAASAPRGAA